jgi:hypothetical protein
LTERERQRFDSAWQKYYFAEKDPRLPYLEKYSKHLSDEQAGIPKQDRRKAATDRIEELLKFAGPK